VEQRDTLRYRMNVSHGEGPWHSHGGPRQRPAVERPAWGSGSCACSFSPICKISLVPCRSDGKRRYTAESCRFSPFCHSHSFLNQLPGGSESVERAERASAVFASAVGPARATSDRPEGGPTGTTELVCGRGRRRGHQPAGSFAPVRPRRSGTCLLRRIPGSVLLSAAGRSREAVESGVSR